jgi:quinol monooxygenase YgiN
MLLVSGTIVMNPDKADRARALIAPLVEATNQEPGCIAYGFFAAVDDPGRLHLHEEWESEAAIDAHVASAHLATFMGAIGELDITHAEIFRYEVTNKTQTL